MASSKRSKPSEAVDQGNPRYRLPAERGEVLRQHLQFLERLMGEIAMDERHLYFLATHAKGSEKHLAAAMQMVEFIDVYWRLEAFSQDVRIDPPEND